MRLLYITLFMLAIACRSFEAHDDNIESADTASKDSINLQHDIEAYEQNSLPTTSLDDLFNNELNLVELKQQFQLLNCGEKLDFLYEPDTTGFFYAYCMHNGALPRQKRNELLPMGERMISFSVFKYGNEIGTYSDRNELLVGVNAIHNFPELRTLNFVGLDTATIVQTLGENYIQMHHAIVYKTEEKLLILNVAEGTVKWFKFYWIKPELNKIKELPKSIFEWKHPFN